MGEKVETLVFKIFRLRLQEQSYFLLTPCCSFQMPPKELCSWAAAWQGGWHSMHARAHDSSTQPSFHITSLLQWQTAPQPFVIITEPFQKDKSCGLPSACYLEHGHGTATHLWEASERAAESPLTLAPGISGGHTTFLLLRSKSQEKNPTPNKMNPSRSLFLHWALELFWFCPGKCWLPIQRFTNCYDVMVRPQANSSVFHS